MTKPPKKPLSLYNHFLKLERAAIAVTMPESATTCEVRSRRLGSIVLRWPTCCRLQVNKQVADLWNSVAPLLAPQSASP